MKDNLTTLAAHQGREATRDSDRRGRIGGSGVPTFRGPGGLWRQIDLRSATPAASARDPRLVWE
jgi:hypothetical protein